MIFYLNILYDACVLRKYPMVLTQVPKPMAPTPFVSICHAEFSMFRRVKSGTINASQLFFQGSHAFSIFNLRIHACNKNKITTFYRWQWKYLTALLSKFVPYGDHNVKDKCGIKHKIIKKTNPVNTLRPRDSFCFLLVSSHFFYPNCNRPIPAQKVDLNNKYEYHSASQSTARKFNVPTPSITSSEPLPKRLENPSGAMAEFAGHIHLGPRRDQQLDHGCMAFLSRPMQRRPASGAKDATPTAGRLRLPSRNKA